MAKVLVGLKIFPEGLEVDLEDLTRRIGEKLPEDYKIVRRGEEPIAFGLKALKLYISIPEETEGGTDTLERIISEVEGVSQVEVEMVTRMS